MTINWNSIIEGASAGVAASVLLGLFVISREFVRDFVLRLRISRSFRLLSCGNSIDGITVGVANRVGTPFTLRQLMLETTKMNYRFNPSGEVTSCFKGQYPKISRKQRRQLKEGKIEAIEMSCEMQYKTWHTKPTQEGFTLIAPHTRHQFVLPAEIVVDMPNTVKGFQLVVEYSTWRNVVKVMKVVTKDNNEQIGKAIASYQQEIECGSLDEVRSSFGKPPVQKAGGMVTPEG